MDASYPGERTALLLIDPYNDFLSEGGKLNGLAREIIEKIVLIGMIANTCLEATGRYGMELGYHVTLVRDATAAFSAEAMHAAHAINGPTYAHAIVDTRELLAAFPQ